MLSESYAHYRKKLANEQLPKGKSRREEAEALLKTVTGLRVA